VKPEVTGTYKFRVAVYEGSWLPEHGAWIETVDKIVSFVAGVSANVQVVVNSTLREQSRRDIQVNIISLFYPDSGEIVYSREWDDVFYVTPAGGNGDGEPNVTFSGQITNVQLKPGTDASNAVLLISWIATALNWWDGYGWETRISVAAGGPSDTDSQNHYGSGGSRTNQELSVGSLAPGAHQAIVTLEAKGLLGQWQLLDTHELALTVPYPEEPEDGEEPGEVGFPWLPVVLLAGGAATLLLAGRKK
ncbi:MAG: hypothetical protein U1B77_02470, partial [Dehalococcoidales bacterium]|nr:hypothetical protein [Dehalococcoidales bacterium]